MASHHFSIIYRCGSVFGSCESWAWHCAGMEPKSTPLSWAGGGEWSLSLFVLWNNKVAFSFSHCQSPSFCIKYPPDSEWKLKVKAMQMWSGMGMLSEVTQPASRLPCCRLCLTSHRDKTLYNLVPLSLTPVQMRKSSTGFLGSLSSPSPWCKPEVIPLEPFELSTPV